MSRDFNRGSKRYRRKPSQVSSGKSFLIVSEGSKTEPNYFHSLSNFLKLKPTDIVIPTSEGTDPITLTRQAIDLKTARQKIAKRSSFLVPYDEVWVVFDLEKPHDERRELAKKATLLKGAEDIFFAHSDPSFEFWLLLHERYTTHPFRDSAEVEKMFKSYHDDYRKSWRPSEEFLKKIPVAIEGAERCRNHHETCAGDGNPSTYVDRLVRSLNSATRPHFQIKLR